jgi:STIP1 family protein 1
VSLPNPPFLLLHISYPDKHRNPSIQKNPREPTFFTNRALTRIRLEQWAGVEHDARAAIDLYGAKNPTRIKSCYYLAQALLGLNKPQEAYDVAIDAYRASLAGKNAQTENLSRAVLRAKQQIWAARETARLRDMNETLASVEGLIESDLNRGLGELQARLDREEIGQIGLRRMRGRCGRMRRRMCIMCARRFGLRPRGRFRRGYVTTY